VCRWGDTRLLRGWTSASLPVASRDRRGFAGRSYTLTLTESVEGHRPSKKATGEGLDAARSAKLIEGGQRSLLTSVKQAAI